MNGSGFVWFVMKNNTFLGHKILDLILDHNHGKIQAAKLPSIHSVKQWMNMTHKSYG